MKMYDRISLRRTRQSRRRFASTMQPEDEVGGAPPRSRGRPRCRRRRGTSARSRATDAERTAIATLISEADDDRASRQRAEQRAPHTLPAIARQQRDAAHAAREFELYVGFGYQRSIVASGLIVDFAILKHVS